MKLSAVLTAPMTPMYAPAERPKDMFVVRQCLYVVCNESAMVKVYSVEDLTPVTEIPVGKKPDHLIYVAPYILVASRASNTLTRIDTRTNKASGKVLAVSGGIARMAAVENFAVVPRFDLGDYVLVDADKMVLVGSLVSTQSNPRAAIVVVEDLKKVVYVACASGRTIMSFDLLTGKVINAKIGVKGGPHAAFHGIFAGKYGEIFVLYQSGDGQPANMIGVFAGGKYEKSFELPDVYAHGQIVWLDRGVTLAVACQGSVVLLDVSSGDVLDQLAFDGAEPFGLAAVLHEDHAGPELMVGVKDPRNAVFKYVAETELVAA